MKERKLLISSGRGPAECNWVVAKLLKEVISEARKSGLDCRVVQRIEGELPNTLLSATVIVSGKNVSEFTREWLGSVLWTGQSPYRKFHKRKNWFVQVHERQVLSDQTLNPNDIKIDVMRASGPGGQHVNKTSSAVRMVHLPTGLSVTIQESRSQLQNRKIALQRLQEQYEEHRMSKLEEDTRDQWKSGIEVQRGNPVRVYEGTRFKRIK